MKVLQCLMQPKIYMVFKSLQERVIPRNMLVLRAGPITLRLIHHINK